MAARKDPAAYALVVSSAEGGAGQLPLQYADLDAQRVAEVLSDLGHYRGENIMQVQNPDREGLIDAMIEVQHQLRQHAQRGERSRLFFYYSGHARANALNLGDELFALPELRERLVGMGATVTVTVLDACQSGAFSHIKGTVPAADFSFNSTSQLNAEGLVVLASSAGSELSQESDDLAASFFTHHLLVALRGAGDLDQDGRVSLGEAYGYAYNRTLSTTSRTAVGGQHVTLETNLKGKGELVLSYPVDADAHVSLPAGLAGKLVFEQKSSGAVLVELEKASGSSIRLALPRGKYAAIVRAAGMARACELDLSSGGDVPLDLRTCHETLASGAAKGESFVIEQPWEKAIIYSEKSRNPMVAFMLGMIPLPGGLGHAYNDQFVSHGAFFTVVELSEVIALAALWYHSTTVSKAVERDLFTNYWLRPGDESGKSSYDLESLEHKGAMLGVGVLFLATKLFEALDAYHQVRDSNARLRNRLRETPVRSLSLAPSRWGGAGKGFRGGVVTVTF